MADLILLVWLRPFLYVLLMGLVVYWIARFIYWIMPAGKIKDFLFRRR